MTIITGLIFAHKIIGLSIGMLIADLGVGRVIAVFQHLFYEKMEARITGTVPCGTKRAGTGSPEYCRGRIAEGTFRGTEP